MDLRKTACDACRDKIHVADSDNVGNELWLWWIFISVGSSISCYLLLLASFAVGLSSSLILCSLVWRHGDCLHQNMCLMCCVSSWPMFWYALRRCTIIGWWLVLLLLWQFQCCILSLVLVFSSDVFWYLDVLFTHFLWSPSWLSFLYVQNWSWPDKFWNKWLAFFGCFCLWMLLILLLLCLILFVFVFFLKFLGHSRVQPQITLFVEKSYPKSKSHYLSIGPQNYKKSTKLVHIGCFKISAKWSIWVDFL